MTLRWALVLCLLPSVLGLRLSDVFPLLSHMLGEESDVLFATEMSALDCASQRAVHEEVAPRRRVWIECPADLTLQSVLRSTAEHAGKLLAQPPSPEAAAGKTRFCKRADDADSGAVGVVLWGGDVDESDATTYLCVDRASSLTLSLFLWYAAFECAVFASFVSMSIHYFCCLLGGEDGGGGGLLRIKSSGGNVVQAAGWRRGRACDAVHPGGWRGGSFRVAHPARHLLCDSGVAVCAAGIVITIRNC
jgi:hypothetical protein